MPAAQTGTNLRMIERTYFKFVRSAMPAKVANLKRPATEHTRLGEHHIDLAGLSSRRFSSTAIERHGIRLTATSVCALRGPAGLTPDDGCSPTPRITTGAIADTRSAT